MPKTTPADDLLGAAEVCKILKADRSTVLRWANAGLLDHLKMPGKTGAFLFRRSDVIDFARRERGGVA